MRGCSKETGAWRLQPALISTLNLIGVKQNIVLPTVNVRRSCVCVGGPAASTPPGTSVGHTACAGAPPHHITESATLSACR